MASHLGAQHRAHDAGVPRSAPRGTATALPAVIVGPNVQVSMANAHSVHTEVVLGADPADANNLVACGMLWRTPESGAHTQTVLYTSSDGGLTWTETLRVRGDTGELSADPVCAFGADHSAYLIAHNMPSEFHNTTGNYLVNLVYRSPDAGRTWTRAGDIPSSDRPYMVVNTTANPAHRGEIFVGLIQYNVNALDSGDSGSSLVIYRSANAAQSFDLWSTYVTSERAIVSFGFGGVLQDGRLMLPLVQVRGRPPAENPSVRDANSAIRVVIPDTNAYHQLPRSRDAVLVSEAYQCDTQANWPAMPALAIDHGPQSPFRGRAYVVWPDYRHGRCTILLSSSDDAGRTWSTPILVTDAPLGRDGGPDAFHPMVAVNTDGVVGVSWYDRREAPEALGWRVRFAASTDGGETFLPSVPVSTARMRAGEGERFLLYPSLQSRGRDTTAVGGANSLRLLLTGHVVTGGETAGLAADAAGVFHVLWVDNRTGVIQMWTAPVTVKSVAVKHGSPALAGFADVSRQVALHLGALEVDRVQQVVTTEAYVTNTSADTIVGPLKVRVLALRSDWADVSVAETENGLGGAGAILDFSALLPGGVLPPGAKSGVKRLTIQAREITPFATYVANRARLARPGAADYQAALYDLVFMRFRILAEATRSPRIGAMR